MFGLSTVKLAIIAAILAVVVTLVVGSGLAAKHYHDEWVKATAEVASKDAQLQQALAAAEQCSENTKKLADANKQKEDDVKKAQEQAAQNAQKNKALASKILSMETNNPNRCAAAVDLIHDHKLQLEGK